MSFVDVFRIGQYKNLIYTLENENENLKLRLQSLREEYKNDTDELSHTIQELQEKINLLSARNEKINNDLTEQEKTSNSEIANCKNTISQLTIELDRKSKVESIIKMHENTIENLSQTNAKLSKEIIQKNSIIKENKTNIEQLTQDNNKLIENLIAVELENKQYKRIENDNQDIIKELKQSLDSSDYKIKLLTQQIKEINRFWKSYDIDKMAEKFPDAIKNLERNATDQIAYEKADIKELVIDQLKEFVIYKIPDAIHVVYDEEHASDYVKSIIENIPQKQSLNSMSSDELIFSNNYDKLWEKIINGNNVEQSYEFSKHLFCTVDNYLNIKLFCTDRFLSSKELLKLDCCSLRRNTKIVKENYENFLTLVDEELRDFYNKNGYNLIDTYLIKWLTNDKEFFYKYIDRYKKSHKNWNDYYLDDVNIRMCIGSTSVDFRHMFLSKSRCVYKYIKTNTFLTEFLSVILSDVFRDYENKLREKLNIPKIGEGWTSETQLYNMIKDHFKNTEVIHQGQPKWLGKQRFDIYLPEYNIAIEYQGAQHFKPVTIFGGEEGHKRIVENDKRKKQLSEKNNCVLIYVTENYNLETVIEKINDIVHIRQAGK